MSSPGGRTVARVGVRVLPDTAGFATDLQRYLDRIERQLTVNVRIEFDEAELRAAIARLRQELGDLRIIIRPDLDTDALRAQLRLLIAEINRSQASIQVRADRSGLSSLNNDVRNLSRGATIPIRVVGVASAIAAVTALAAALGQAVAGAGALVPAAVTGLGAVGAAAAIGLSGIGDAFKDQGASAGKAADAVDNAAQRQQDAARQIAAAERDLATARRNNAATAIADAQRITDAQESLVSAVRDEQQAQRDLTKARADAAQQIADLRTQLVGAAADEKQASADLVTARERLAAVQGNDFATPAELAQAQAAVAEAQAKVGETAQKYKDVSRASSDANKAGVNGAQNVLAVQQRITDAQKAQVSASRDLADARRTQANDEIDAANAILDAQDRLVQAQEQQTSANEKAATALAGTTEKVQQLAPAAVALVAAIKSLGPAWTAARLDIQQNLLDGLDQKVRALATNALPSLRRGLAGIADALNLNAKRFLDFAASAETAKSFDVLFANIRTSVANLAPAVKPFNQALLDMARVGSGFLPQLATGLTGLVKTLSSGLSGAANGGGLQKFIDGALVTFNQLGTILRNVGNIFGSVFGAASSGGSALLSVIGDVTGHIGTLLKSVAGQNALSSFFGAIGVAARALAPAINVLADQIPAVLQALAPAIAVLGKALAGGITALAPAFAPLARAIAAVIEALTPLLPLIGQMIGVLLPPLANLVTVLVRAFAPLVTTLATALQPLLPVIAQMINDLATALGPVVTQLVSALQPILPKLAKAAADLLKAFLPIIPSLGDMFTALIPLIPPFANLAVQLLGLATTLMPAFVAAAKLIAPVLNFLVPIIKTVVNAISGIVGVIKNVIGWFGQLVSGVRALPGKIGDIAGDMLNAGSKIMASLFDGIRNALKGAGQFAADLGKTIVNALISAINNFLSLPLKLPRITIYNPIPGQDDFHIGGQTILPAIPKLAEGATINPTANGTLAILAEAGKPESVVDTGLLNKQLALSNRLAEKLANISGVGGGATMHVYGAPGQDEATLAADVNRRWQMLGV
jgi:phage-related protein